MRIGDGVRVYRVHEVPGVMDGRAALLTQRLVKRLENACWESDVEVDDRPSERLVADSPADDPSVRAAEQLLDQLTNRRPPASPGRDRC